MKAMDQFAAIPYLRIDGGLKVMLITSRETRRWIIPKGWPKDEVAPYRLAEQEAFEEAGITGKISKKSLGCFKYRKRLDDGSSVPCLVSVYPLKVRLQYLEWPERMQRDYIWVDVRKAARMVDEKSLRDILLKFAEQED